MSNNIFCIGEALIDMMCVDNKGLKYGQMFEKKAGGAPANVAACISKLEGSAYFLGQFGKDHFGDYLIELFNDLGINTEMAVQQGKTTMSLVGIDEQGERSFEFLRGSDRDYSFSSIDVSKINKYDIIHFGSATGLIDGDLKDTYFKLLDYAVKNDIFVSFDPNYRDNLISDDMLDTFVNDCRKFVAKSSFVKISDEELFLITKEKELSKAVDIMHSIGARAVAVTLGSKGTYISMNGEHCIVPSIKIKQVDSTGAGDAFVGAVLKQLSCIDNKKELGFMQWMSIIAYANKVGALTCTNYGAISSMPSKNDIENLE